MAKENNVIIDLDLAHLNLEKYFIDTDVYLKIIIKLIEKYDMFDSIFFNDSSLKTISKFKEIKNDLSFSVGDMNEKKT